MGYYICIIQGKRGILGIGKVSNGLYYLIDAPMKEVLNKLKEAEHGKDSDHAMTVEKLQLPSNIDNSKQMSETSLWHMRLGHAPMRRISLIEDLKGFDKKHHEICVVCPLAKFTKLPFPESHSKEQEMHLNLCM